MTGIYVLFVHIIGKPRKSRDMIPWNLIKNMISVEITDIVSIICIHVLTTYCTRLYCTECSL